ncbi:UDP-N-acetylmuramoyl-L-alanine--D-glutamate ligase [Brevundimonas sp.]|uniref:UDP-N-acetylmuramoyl-L-alanine--D-glutamate ligase n=1 Tax=Brevundimonas sp. TaxID=1871086 RepID=UPI0025E8CF1F|nr:UDP-N-acetylmuramoyl-L-alanine--D-glutamate ligase [Brevundimonas sp.]
MIPVPGFEGREVAVFGLGRSGLPSARALQARGARPVLWDDGVSGRMQAEAEGFQVEDLTQADWSRFAGLVLSPGVPLTHPKPHWTVDKARAAGVPVIGDIELFARAMAALPEGERPKVVAITGTNGKSTTTALIGWVLNQAGLKAHIGGNIGIGALALPAPKGGEVYVLEVSSYQLDLTQSFAPDVAILTNISPDHLDRHGGMEGYVAAKRKIFDRAGVALVGVDDDWGRRIAGELPNAEAVSVADFDGRLTHAGQDVADLTQARSLPGRHNAQNAAFAYATARALGVPHDKAVAGLMTFPGLAHRMEEVGHVGPVRFINDSKATNADATRQALASYPRSYWIAGGRAKSEGIEPLADLFPRIAKAYLIGEAANDFARVLGAVPHEVCSVMEAAVAAAARDASATGQPEVVLLSPACASFDQYPDFEARGEAFRAAVLGLQGAAA